MSYQPYLQNDLGGFRPAHGAIAVVGRTCVHAHSVVICCCYKNGALRVHYPTWELDGSKEVKIIHNHLGGMCAISYNFYATQLTLSRFKSFPSLVQLTYSTGGSAWTGQTMTPSIPAGRYVSRDIRPTRAGSELEGK